MFTLCRFMKFIEKFLKNGTAFLTAKSKITRLEKKDKHQDTVCRGPSTGYDRETSTRIYSIEGQSLEF